MVEVVLKVVEVVLKVAFVHDGISPRQCNLGAPCLQFELLPAAVRH